MTDVSRKLVISQKIEALNKSDQKVVWETVKEKIAVWSVDNMKNPGVAADICEVSQVQYI